MRKRFLAAAATATVMLFISATLATAQASPSIQVSPTPIGRGQVTTVYGRDFCADPACSAVFILVDDSPLTNDGVQVNSDGTFSFPFVATQIPNQYRVTARQTAADGSLLEATYGLIVMGSDLPSGETPAPVQTLPPTPSASPEATTAPSSSASASETAATQVPSPSIAATGTPPALSNGASGDDGDGSTVALLAVAAVLAALALALAFFVWRRTHRPAV
jgi:hypothetical protein